MITTTLNRIRAHGLYADGWPKLLAHLGKTCADDEPLPFATILESNGLDDALWCCRAEPQHAREWRLFAVWCARRVQHLMTDQRCVNALDVAERYAVGRATDAEMETARSAAWDAARDAARDAWDAAGEAGAATWAAAGGAWVAADTAWDAARSAAWDAAGGAARDTGEAWSAAWDAARDAQSREFLRVITETEEHLK